MFSKRLGMYGRYMSISKVPEIARRYFVMNAFDGALTMFGVLIGVYLSGRPNVNIIIGAGVAGSLAMCISGISGAYLTEKAERTKKLKSLGSAMLIDLDDTIHGGASRFASIVTALVSGTSPALAALTILSPFFAASRGLIPQDTAFMISIALTGLILFGLGAYLAKISDESMLDYGAKMLFVGAITAILSLLVAVSLGGSA